MTRSGSTRSRWLLPVAAMVAICSSAGALVASDPGIVNAARQAAAEEDVSSRAPKADRDRPPRGRPFATQTPTPTPTSPTPTASPETAPAEPPAETPVTSTSPRETPTEPTPTVAPEPDSGDHDAAPVEPGARGPEGLPGSWSLAFGDEFSGTAVDPDKWRANRSGGAAIDRPFNITIEGAYFAPANVSVVDGLARFTITPEPRTVAGVAYSHSSGMLSSEGQFWLADGDYVEARVRVPTGDGLWPAFWSAPSDRWPPEIDGFEFFDTTVQSQPRADYHPADGSFVPSRVYGEAGVDYRDSWHTYGMLRDGGRYVPYVDGVAYPQAGVSSGVDDLPQYILLNLSMYSGNSPTPGTSMAIDWVRAWRPS